MANTTWEVKLVQRGGKVKDVTITLGPKAERTDVLNELYRQGIGGLIMTIRKQAEASTKRVKKVHYRLDTHIGPCGYMGETTRDKDRVTCKVCKKLLKSGRYLH